MRKCVLSVTLTLCVIGVVMSVPVARPGSGRGRLMPAASRTEFSIEATLRDMERQIRRSPDTSVNSVTRRRLDDTLRPKMTPVLLSMMCAFCRRRGHRACIVRMCSRTSQAAVRRQLEVR
ncbi:uncharacterized protein LOC124137690 [Haliotis rufescens]|uniref:uncharacterized protein LOC124137690 n=1 Tax=Haliotis rufescens TaxID=6454 RepID=UPI001EAFBFA2|nr:uncharacterized protein LOC124137690 [Haliotis rufescens]XP_046360055.1 uncharacterized protein LOC124137690 [Haliotis rufescens]XP_048247619.1 uncharacterized protein LOC124137690 [Haliotis rufescens]